MRVADGRSILSFPHPLPVVVAGKMPRVYVQEVHLEHSVTTSKNDLLLIRLNTLHVGRGDGHSTSSF